MKRNQIWGGGNIAIVFFVAFSSLFMPMQGWPVRVLPFAHGAEENNSGLRLATFDLDATPPVGFMMAYDRVRRIDEIGLRFRGVILLGAGEPIVLCAIDWIGVGNEANEWFRQRIASAVETTPTRVAVHALHQHDAPRCDFGAERLLNEVGASDLGAHDGSFARELLARLTPVLQSAVSAAKPITHVGFGAAEVKEVASNRRIQDENGKVVATRYTATRDAALRALPEGTIDPVLSSISFWNQAQPLAVLTYYACHPQSYYRTGVPSPDFPGIARFIRGQALPETLHVHFNGAGGNIGAGKYNDGAQENRMVLADRLADGMRRAYLATEKVSIEPSDVKWSVVPVHLPPAKHLDEKELEAGMLKWDGKAYWGSPDKLAWLQRCKAGIGIDVGCLQLGDIRVLHLPGELFVEYQLAAKAMRPDLKVAMAAYGDYGPAYIGTAEAYSQGGYETSRDASNVAPEAEAILIDAMKTLLEVQK